MGTPEQNADLVRGGLEAWAAGDVDGTLSVLTEDVEVFVPPELGNAGTYRGRDQFMRWTKEWDEAWAEWTMTVERVEPVGDHHVVALVRSRATGAGSGIEVENLLGWVLSVGEDGTCGFISLQPDLDGAIALARERESA
jgi:ketosteroid isomerase-like protein